MTVERRESGAPDVGHDPGENARLEAAVKTYDGFFSTFFVNPYTKLLAPGAARLGVSPTAVTLVSLAVGLAAAASFAIGSRPALVAGAVLFVLSFYLDGLDGTLARFTGRFSSFGGWLDSVADRAKEYAVYAGLAAGSVRGFEEDVWTLAAAALALQVVRHVGDAAYVSVGRRSRPHHGETARPRPARRLQASSIPIWLHRIVRFPVGERIVVVALTAALASPRVTFFVLLAWGILAWVYTVAGRVAYDHPATRRAVREVVG